MIVYQELASAIYALKQCVAKNNLDMVVYWKSKINRISRDYLPHGSGIDGGNIIETEKSNDRLIVIKSSYHKMNDVGYYDGWIDFTVTIKPAFVGIDFNIKGKFATCPDIKDYLSDLYYSMLTQDMKPYQ